MKLMVNYPTPWGRKSFRKKETSHRFFLNLRKRPQLRSVLFVYEGRREIGRGRKWEGKWTFNYRFFCNASPTKVNGSRTIGSFLHQWFVELPAWARVNHGPAMFTIVLHRERERSNVIYESRASQLSEMNYLETRNISAKERSKSPSRAISLAFITKLIIQNVRFNFNLNQFVSITSSGERN